MKILSLLNLDDGMHVVLGLRYIHTHKIGKHTYNVRIVIFKFGFHMPLLEVVKVIDRMMGVSHIGVVCYLWSMFALG